MCLHPRTMNISSHNHHITDGCSSQWSQILPVLHSFAVNVAVSWLTWFLTWQVCCFSSCSPPRSTVNFCPDWVLPSEVHLNSNNDWFWLRCAEHCSTADTLEPTVCFSSQVMVGLGTFSVWRQKNVQYNCVESKIRLYLIEQINTN